MPLVQTRGAASAQGFGEFAQAAAVPNYIEDVFSTYLYTGTGAALTITNGIDLSTKGGLTWIKGRSGATDHKLTDTARGVTKALVSNSTAAETTDTTGLTAFGTTGFTLGADANYNTSAATYASWTFREQPKFFDVVTWTGNGSGSRAISHALASTPGCIMIKRTDASDNWYVVHRSVSSFSAYGVLNSTAAFVGSGSGVSSVGSSTFTVSNYYNATSETWVAYLFAHDAGGFGLAGTDNVISCGSLTGSGAGIATTVTLGYEPQFILAKVTGTAQNWVMFDNMRGFDNTNAARLFPNLSNAESTVPAANYFTPTATGFTYGPGNSMGDTANIIYIAIRRGPMKVPTVGTSVFSPVARAGTGATATVTAGFPVDMTIIQDRNGLNSYATAFDRLRGATKRLFTALNLAEASEATSLTGFDVQTGFTLGTDVGFGAVNTSPDNYINWCFGRAPGFFDEVCYTGTAVGTSQTHNLGVIPELKIIKSRSAAAFWVVGGSIITGVGARANNAVLDTNAAVVVNAAYWDVADTSTTFSVRGNNSASDTSGTTYVAYLFATCAGVSKVGSYTGNGSTQTINCGFTGGARFVLIKRTDSTGDWYVYDTARGMTVLTDPYLLLNTTAAEVATLGSVTTVSTGFALDSAILAAINVSAGSYIFLAVA